MVPVSGDESLERTRARIRAARGAAQQARVATARADETLTEVELLRRRLPVVAAAVEQAGRSVRAVRRVGPGTLWYAGRGELAAERERRGARLRAALAERDDLLARIAGRECRARDYRAESLRLRATAAALPRLLDEAAGQVHRTGGPLAQALSAAEAGLEPVLRREADLDQAVRWIRWSRVHVGDALDRLGTARTGAGYRDYFRLPEGHAVTGHLLGDDGLAGWPDRRAEAARQALCGVRDVLTVLVRALAELGVTTEPLTVPDLPVDLHAWFADPVADSSRGERVTSALDACERAATGLAELLQRVEGDHAATRRVLEGRRAHWCALLRGE